MKMIRLSVCTGSRVEDVTELNSGAVSWYSLLASVMSTSSSGKRWVFGEERGFLIAAHEADSGWARSSIPLKTNSGAYLAARMVDDNLGYLTYAIDSEVYAPHLVTWDGSCWTDQVLAGEATPTSTVVAVDDKKQPWVAWLSGGDHLNLRHPSGDIQNLLSVIPGDELAAMIVQSPLRVLPGGLDGSAAFPLVAVRPIKAFSCFPEKRPIPHGIPSSCRSQPSQGPTRAIAPRDLPLLPLWIATGIPVSGSRHATPR